MSAQFDIRAKEEKAKKFWDYKAKRYPLPFEERSLATTRKVIEIVKNKGIKLTNARILDVGCGTGNYTLPLALEAISVTGIDFSEAMIDRLTDQINKHNIVNVSILRESWKDVNVVKLFFEKAFDVVWASMTMAVRDEDDVKKMEACSKEWGVYVGWGGKRKNPVMEEVFADHNMAFGPPPGAEIITNILKDMGRTHSLDYINTSWDWSGTLDEAVEDISNHIEVFGGNPRNDAIKDILLNYDNAGLIKHTTEAEIGIVTWCVK